MYSILYSRPLSYQLLSLVGIAITTLSSWLYGKLFASYSRGRKLKFVIAGTTVLAAVVSVGNMLFVRLLLQASSCLRSLSLLFLDQNLQSDHRLQRRNQNRLSHRSACHQLMMIDIQDSFVFLVRSIFSSPKFFLCSCRRMFSCENTFANVFFDVVC